MSRDAFATVSEMEESVANVRRWGRVLVELGSGTSMIDPNTAWIIGTSLLDLGTTLKDDWEDAMEASRRQS